MNSDNIIANVFLAGLELQLSNMNPLHDKVWSQFEKDCMCPTNIQTHRSLLKELQSSLNENDILSFYKLCIEYYVFGDFDIVDEPHLKSWNSLFREFGIKERLVTRFLIVDPSYLKSVFASPADTLPSYLCVDSSIENTTDTKSGTDTKDNTYTDDFKARIWGQLEFYHDDPYIIEESRPSLEPYLDNNDIVGFFKECHNHELFLNIDEYDPDWINEWNFLFKEAGVKERLKSKYKFMD